MLAVMDPGIVRPAVAVGILYGAKEAAAAGWLRDRGNGGASHL